MDRALGTQRGSAQLAADQVGWVSFVSQKTPPRKQKLGLPINGETGAAAAAPVTGDVISPGAEADENETAESRAAAADAANEPRAHMSYEELAAHYDTEYPLIFASTTPYLRCGVRERETRGQGDCTPHS